MRLVDAVNKKKEKGMIQLVNLKKINGLHADEIQRAVSGVVESGWYLKGRATEQFEKAYAAYIGTRHCVACGNGLDALTLILRAYIELGRLHEGDEVIVPANTYIASMIAVSRCGLRPVPVEPRIDTLQIDDTLVERTVTGRTRAVMIVHMYGRCAYTDRIGELCRRRGLLLIEDNAQAHGCRYGGFGDAADGEVRRTGSLGHAAGHSFYPTKNIGALGDAGAVTTDDDELAAMVRSLGNYGSSRKYVFPYVGLNSRMDEIQAAVLSVKLRYVEAENARRRENARYYMEHISNPLVALPSEDYWRESVFHIFPVLSPRRAALQEWLAANGIQTDIHYPVPPHHQGAYAAWTAMSLPVTERIHREELSIPVSQVVTDGERGMIAKAINEFKG